MNLRGTLRTLVLCEVGLAAISIAEAQLGRRLLPVELQTYAHTQEERDLSTADFALIGIAIPAFALLIVAWIGLWRFWPRARVIYTAAWALALVMVAFGGATVGSWLGQLLGYLGALVAGMILGITYFSDLRHQFGPRAPAA
jgi:hypothetical protein